MANVVKFLVLVLCLVLDSNSAYRILGIFPHTGYSHFAMFKPLLQALAERGHEVTVYSHFPLKREVDNYVDVSLEGTCPSVDEMMQVDKLSGSRIEKYLGIAFVRPFAQACCMGGLASEQARQLARSNTTYDLILMEYFNTHCFAGFINKFKAPVVGLSSHILMPWVNDWTGNPDNPSYVPIIHMDYSDEQTFLERVEHVLVYLQSKAYYHSVMTSEAVAYSRRYLGLRIPDGIMYETSLVLVNSHYSLNRPRPLVPNVIEVGGLHIAKRGQLPAVC